MDLKIGSRQCGKFSQGLRNEFKTFRYFDEGNLARFSNEWNYWSSFQNESEKQGTIRTEWENKDDRTSAIVDYVWINKGTDSNDSRSLPRQFFNITQIRQELQGDLGFNVEYAYARISFPVYEYEDFSAREIPTHQMITKFVNKSSSILGSEEKGHVDRQCKEPQRKMDSKYFKDKALTNWKLKRKEMC
ncbi:hypothetical protein Tco_0257008 [Tanacetum coccineum]